MASLADLLDYDQRKKQLLQSAIDQYSKGYGVANAFTEGLADQAKGMGQMVMHPIDTAKQLYEGGKAAIQNPQAALQAAKEGLTEVVNSPENIARFAGQNFNPMDIANALNKVGKMRELTVYHGTPHTFENFDASKIGSGTGQQAFGHGIYVAENPKIAKSYVASGNPDLHGMANQEGLENWNRNTGVEFRRQVNVENKTPEQVVRSLQTANADARNMPKEKLESLVSKWREANKGNFYTVDLPDEKIERMLDWHKPFNEQHPEVQKGLKDYAELSNIKIDPEMTGRKIYDLFGKVATKGKDLSPTDFNKVQKAASEQLKWAGIPGIKYLDNLSADAETGTRNFVVFPGEEQNLKILKRE